MKDFETWLSDFEEKTKSEDGNPYESDFEELKSLHETLKTGLDRKDDQIKKLEEENTKLKDRVWQLFEKTSITKKKPEDDNEKKPVNPKNFVVIEED